MKKATQIVLLVAGIIAIILAVLYFVLGILYVAAGVFVALLDAGSITWADLPQWAIDLLEKISAGHTYETLAAASAGLIAGGVVLLIMAILCVPAAILSFQARSKDSKGLYIACIVLGVLSGTGVAMIGGILGLIHQAVDKPQLEHKAEEPKAEEPKAE